jgi:pimeloyl-ACP methyl ester carboxylesterase
VRRLHALKNLEGAIDEVAALATFEWPPYLKMKIPVHIWHGEDDESVNWRVARRLAKLIPGAQLHLLPDVGHDVLRDLPRLKDFLLSIKNIHAGDNAVRFTQVGASAA